MSKIYVKTVDTFMSGWGRAESKTNVCVCECSTQSEAESVKTYAKERGDQKQVQIVNSYPVEADGIIISNTDGWVETAERLGY